MENNKPVERRIMDTSRGTKEDGGKPRWSLLPAGVVPLLVATLEYGAKRYGPVNWQSVPDARTRYYDAAMRHLQSWWSGQTHDEESRLPHMAHVMCNAAFLLWFDPNKPRDV